MGRGTTYTRHRKNAHCFHTESRGLLSGRALLEEGPTSLRRPKLSFCLSPTPTANAATMPLRHVWPRLPFRDPPIELGTQEAPVTAEVKDGQLATFEQSVHRTGVTMFLPIALEYSAASAHLLAGPGCFLKRQFIGGRAHRDSLKNREKTASISRLPLT